MSLMYRGGATAVAAAKENSIAGGPESSRLDCPGLPLNVDVSCCLEPSATSTTFFHEPTEHELHCKSSVAGWDKVRKAIQMVVTEQAAMDEVPLCLLCGELANLRCQRCGPLGLFCSKCFLSYHSEANIFHVAEKWEVSNIDILNYNE